MKKGSQLSHEVINLAWSLLWGKRNIGDFKILDWNGISSHKEEEKILGKCYLPKKRNIGYFFA